MVQYPKKMREGRLPMYETLKLPDLLFAGLMILYGLIYWMAPPKFRGKNSIRTRNTRQSPEAWFYGHTLLGKLFLLTGVLLALNLPSSTSWWIALTGCIVAIGVAKMSFGGLGQNIFNPAITGRVFLMLSFPQQMTDWTVKSSFLPQTDAVSGATLLGCYKEGGMEELIANGYDPNDLSLLYHVGGSAGEISILALLLGFAYLLLRRVVKPWIPLSIFGTVAVISAIFNFIDPLEYTGPLFNLLTGGLVLGACFMATDYVTSPMSNWGGVIYGIGIGFIVMMIRYFGSYPEGLSFAILIMNMAVPLIDMKFHNKRFGRK